MVDSDRPAAAHIGVVGLAVMGSSLARNFARHGYTVALFNRTRARTDDLVAAHGREGRLLPCGSVAEFAASLERPRRILMMVKAGPPTDPWTQAGPQHQSDHRPACLRPERSTRPLRAGG